MTALEANIDSNLKGSYPAGEVYKVSKTANLQFTSPLLIFGLRGGGVDLGHGDNGVWISSFVVVCRPQGCRASGDGSDDNYGGSLVLGLGGEGFDRRLMAMMVKGALVPGLRSGVGVMTMAVMAEIARQCLSEDVVNRPEMRQIVTTLSQILMSSIEWEASLAGRSQVFSGLSDGR
ncbi:unnamed protein product [Ilex paraguariensis]|uniref:Serine-threonine/tyrosine-protein kinase catalytic domain-containing protein n=1 Tax=Ilex paraguariensis TaxID=185542 RepID=A0ABC8RBV1_9AQUA